MFSSSTKYIIYIYQQNKNTCTNLQIEQTSYEPISEQKVLLQKKKLSNTKKNKQKRCFLSPLFMVICITMLNENNKFSVQTYNNVMKNIDSSVFLYI